MGPIDPSRLSRWFDAYGAALSLYARQWLEAGLADDIVQDVFIRLMSQRAEPRNVKAWLFRSVRNAAISGLRSGKRRQRHEEQAAARRPAWFEARAEDLIDAATAQDAMMSLPSDQREVLVLRIWATMTLRDIAELLDEPVSTVFSRYQAGLEGIRNRLVLSCRTKND